MEIVLTIPEDLRAKALHNKSGVEVRQLLEYIGVELYKADALTSPQLQEMLGVDRFELDGILKAHGVFFDYSPEQLEREVETIRKLQADREEDTNETIGERLERKGLIGIINSSTPGPDSPPIHTPFGQLLVEKFGKQGLHLSRHFLSEAQLGVGDQVSLSVEGDSIAIRKAPKKKYNLADLVAQFPKGREAKEESFGAPVGKEVW